MLVFGIIGTRINIWEGDLMAALNLFAINKSCSAYGRNGTVDVSE